MERTGTFKDTLSVPNYKHRNNLAEVTIIDAGKGQFFVGDDEHRGAVAKTFDASKPAFISNLVTEDGEIIPLMHNSGAKATVVVTL